MPARVIVARRRAFALKEIERHSQSIGDITGAGRLPVPVYPRDKDLEQTLQLEALAIWLGDVAAELERGAPPNGATAEDEATEGAPAKSKTSRRRKK